MEEFLPATLSLWLTHYGSLALFFLMAMGIFALPTPDETLMILAGILVAQDKLSPIPTIIAAIGGAIVGITISYVIGRTVGVFLIHKYGHWLRITEKRMQSVHNWFERIGRWALLIGYFVPGIRHLTGYAAGITSMEYHHFALFSYSGAIIWALIFLSIGYFLGDQWESIVLALEEQWISWVIMIVVIASLAAFFTWQYQRKKKLKTSAKPTP